MNKQTCQDRIASKWIAHTNPRVLAVFSAIRDNKSCINGVLVHFSQLEDLVKQK